MPKIIQILALCLIILLLPATAVFGSPETLQAENGLIQPPTGLEFNFSEDIIKSYGSATLAPEIKVGVSYGMFQAITVTGEIMRSWDGSLSEKLVKFYFSPVHNQQGYTVYFDYDLDKVAIPVYGVSLWYNSRFLLAFINLQNQTGVQPGTMPVTITPGVSLRLGKLGISGETVVLPNNWNPQVLRAGITYPVFPKIYAKLSVSTGLAGKSDQLCQLGLCAKI